MTDTKKKPPVGILPATMFYAGRMFDLEAAMARYDRAGVPHPAVWETEVHYLTYYPAWFNEQQADKLPPRPSAEEIGALVQALINENQAYHGGTHPSLKAAAEMLARLKPVPVPTPHDLMKKASE